MINSSYTLYTISAVPSKRNLPSVSVFFEFKHFICMLSTYLYTYSTCVDTLRIHEEKFFNVNIINNYNNNVCLCLVVHILIPSYTLYTLVKRKLNFGERVNSEVYTLKCLFLLRYNNSLI